MKVSSVEFLRRFVQHILPHGFVRIRPGGVPHYAFLASKNKSKELNRVKADLNQPKWEKQKYSIEQIFKPELCIRKNKNM